MATRNVNIIAPRKVKVEVINVDISVGDAPTLAQWAGMKVGDILEGQVFDDGTVWAQAGRHHESEDFGITYPADWFELNEGEYKVIEE